ncbi:protein kinase family protein [Trueperella bialowiezensis]|uniref:Uncharacterized protein n=1 Tax=Trueperella bialowiezensis TaxID=312285 RepID=A0A3S4VAM9_9ACTO|nr:hypothetical protein [Trueperella bialowiezensis]VEI13336.1 Uncharacterised protein [Trueperella bialowiezensis]
MIAGRFELEKPYKGNADAWIARDTALSRQVRVMKVDDDAVIDAARRAALIVDPHLVPILQVVAEEKAYVSEIPQGKPLADYLTGRPNAELVHVVMGEVTRVIAKASRRGVHHLQVNAHCIYIGDDVTLDGLGVHAALAGIDTDADPVKLERDEARGLTVLIASLLLGRDMPEADEHDAVIAEAAELDTPMAGLLRQERDGDGAASAADLSLRFTPWGKLPNKIEWPALDSAALPKPASTLEQVEDVIDDRLNIDERHQLKSEVEWPSLTEVPKAAPKTVEEPIDVAPEVSEPAPKVSEPAPAVSVAAPEATDEEPTLNSSRFVLAFFGILVVVIGFFAIKALTAPFDPVTLQDPDSDIVREETEPAEPAEPAEPPAPEPTNPPAIAQATLVSPDAGMIAGTDPATLDNPSSVGNAVDGNPGTQWKTWTYVNASMAPMSGIGLHIELQDEAVVSEVVLDTQSTGGNIQIRDTVPDAPSSGKVVAEGTLQAGETTFTLNEPLKTRSFIMWITELPKNGAGENQLIVNEIKVK